MRVWAPARSSRLRSARPLPHLQAFVSIRKTSRRGSDGAPVPASASPRSALAVSCWTADPARMACRTSSAVFPSRRNGACCSFSIASCAGSPGRAKPPPSTRSPIFRRVKPTSFPGASLRARCRLLRPRDFATFCEQVGALQAAMGAYFAPLQGGLYASPRVGAVLDWLRGEGVTGLGQSSWGPTGFAFAASQAEGLSLLSRLRAAFQHPGLSFELAQGRNEGAKIETSLVRMIQRHAQAQRSDCEVGAAHQGQYELTNGASNEGALPSASIVILKRCHQGPRLEPRGTAKATRTKP